MRTRAGTWKITSRSTAAILLLLSERTPNSTSLTSCTVSRRQYFVMFVRAQPAAVLITIKIEKPILKIVAHKLDDAVQTA